MTCALTTTLLLTVYYSIVEVNGDFCGENKIPFGLEVRHNAQPTLICIRPSCFEKRYGDCDDRALRKSCDQNNTWVGGFDKGIGYHQPLYVQCCESDELLKYSTALYSGVVVRPGEYFEGEEQVDPATEELVSFDIITNLKLIHDPNTTVAYLMDVRRMHCYAFENTLKNARRIQWP